MGKGLASKRIRLKRDYTPEPSSKASSRSPAHTPRKHETKGCASRKNVKLVEWINPRWGALAKDWGEEYNPETEAHQREIPSPPGENAGLRDDALVEANLADKPCRSR